MLISKLKLDFKGGTLKKYSIKLGLKNYFAIGLG